MVPQRGQTIGNDAERSFVILNTFTIGLLIFGLAQLEYVALQRWEEVAAILAGLWLIASPYIFGYSGTLCYSGIRRLADWWRCSAALQLWQDWDLSEQDLARHGQ